ncbi:MAG: PASTA domain-containing protein [Bacillota bacterium]|nr:PASTA domain-containing protein [Bacillota bacterium]
MSLCMSCMKEIDDYDVCPICGFDNSEHTPFPYLPLRTILQDRYVIGKMCSENNESICYLCYDNVKNVPAIIREFFPKQICRRSYDDIDVFVDDENFDTYKELQKEFLAYFRKIAKLSDISALPSIYGIFGQNNTLYTVEEKFDLIDFSEYMERSKNQLEWSVARPLFMPLLNAVSELHRNGIGHYGIAPQNLFVTPNGKIKLLGFSIESARKAGTPIDPELYFGASAPEQYEPDSILNDSTDVYGFAATLYYALTGNLPDDVEKRKIDGRLLMSTSTVKRLPPHVVTALANGLQMEPENRIPNFEKLRSQLSAAPTVKAIQEEISRTSTIETPDYNKKSDAKQKPWFIISAAISFVVFTIIGIVWLSSNPLSNLFNSSGNATVAPTKVAEQGWTGPTVPDLTGKIYDDLVKATSSSNSIQIYRSFQDQYSDTVPKGAIISQSPLAGAAIKEASGSAVYVVVSKGPMYQQLPDIKNMSVNEAATKLGNMGFLVNETDQYSDTVAQNIVIDYSANKAGDKIASGSTITLIVSKGKQPAPTQSPTTAVSSNNAVPANQAGENQ